MRPAVPSANRTKSLGSGIGKPPVELELPARGKKLWWNQLPQLAAAGAATVRATTAAMVRRATDIERSPAQHTRAGASSCHATRWKCRNVAGQHGLRRRSRDRICKVSRQPGATCQLLTGKPAAASAARASATEWVP